LKVPLCCDYPNRTTRPSAVVLHCSRTLIALDHSFIILFSALHLSDICKRINGILQAIWRQLPARSTDSFKNS
jgi:hypothetical protein